MVEINYAAEGVVDAALAERLIRYCGGVPGTPIVAGGKSKLDPSIQRYVNSARFIPWLILRDLDNDAACAPVLRNGLSDRALPLLCLRIVVREVEAWIMADKAGLSGFLRVRPARIPDDPEDVPDPKQALINAARTSTSKGIRDALVPRAGVGATEGPEFAAHMVEFVSKHWDIGSALEASPEDSSLARAVRCLRRLILEAQKPEYGLVA